MKKLFTPIITLFLVLLTLSCRYKGEVVIDHPEVFTRERLVSERNREKNWLNIKINYPKYEIELQGYRDFRSFTGLISEFKAKYDQEIDILGEARIDSESQEIRNQAEIMSFQHQLDVLKLQQQIDELKNNNSSGNTSEQKKEAEASSNSSNSMSTSGNTNSGSGSEYQSNLFKKENLPSLPDSSSIQASRAKLTTIEALRDEKSYRDAIQALLRETELDDTHDLYGRTLYTLKFDVSILPGKRNSKPANINIILNTDDFEMPNPEPYPELYKQWRESLDNEIRFEALDLQEKVDQGLLTEKDKKLFAAETMQYSWNKNPYDKKGIESLLKLLLDKEKTYIIDSEAKKNINETICNIVMDRYRSLTDLMTSFSPFKDISDSRNFFYSNIDTDDLFFTDIQSIKEKLLGYNIKINEIEDYFKKLEAIKRDVVDCVKTDIENLLNDKEVQLEDQSPPNVKKTLKIEVVLSKLKKLSSGSNLINDIQFELLLKIAEDLKSKLGKQEKEIKKASQNSPSDLKIKNKIIKYIVSTGDSLDSIINDLKLESVHSIEEIEKFILTIEDVIKEIGGTISSINLNNSFEKLRQLDSEIKGNPENKVDKNEIINYLKQWIYYKERLKYSILREQQYERFVKAIKVLKEDCVSYVYTVEPKEYAQNISEVAATEKIKNFIVSLQVLMPKKGLSTDSYLNYVKHSQELLNGIQRSPLVVGYINNKTDFGWILSPRFQINKKGKAVYYQTPLQYSLQASIIVPGWLKKIILEGNYSWGFRRYIVSRASSVNHPIRLEFEVPGDMSSLTKGLLEMKGALQRSSYSEPVISTSQIVLQSGRKESVLIRGKNLWRNPQVFIGSQKAENVEILPDMGGVLATFDKVNSLARLSQHDNSVDLTVITSVGITSLPQAVTILPPTDQWEEGTVSIESNKTNKGGELVLSATSNLLPKSIQSSMLNLRIKEKNGDSWTSLGNPSQINLGKEKTKIAFQNIKFESKPAEMVADLQLMAPPRNEFISIPSTGGVIGSFIFFQDPADWDVVLETKKVQILISEDKDKNREIKIPHDILFSFASPELFLKANKGLSEALNSSLKIGFSILSDDSESISGILSFEKDQFKNFVSKTGATKGKGIIQLLATSFSNSGKNKDVMELIAAQFGENIKEIKLKLYFELQNGEKLNIKEEIKVTK